MNAQVQFLKKKLDQDKITFRPKGNDVTVNGELSIVKFRDKDTNQLIIYLPAFDISSYGETEKKCIEMLNATVQDYFTHLGKLSQKKRESELQKMGWKRNTLKHKEFSRAYIDISGSLQNFNIDDPSKIERLSIVA